MSECRRLLLSSFTCRLPFHFPLDLRFWKQSRLSTRDSWMWHLRIITWHMLEKEQEQEQWTIQGWEDVNSMFVLVSYTFHGTRRLCSGEVECDEDERRFFLHFFTVSFASCVCVVNGYVQCFFSSVPRAFTSLSHLTNLTSFWSKKI